MISERRHIFDKRGLARLFVSASLLTLALVSKAQETRALPDSANVTTPLPTREEQGGGSLHSTLFGYGRVRQLDTYLSPLNYKGGQIEFLHETLRPARNRRLSIQTLWQMNLSKASNEAGKTNLMGGDISFDAGLHYNWYLKSLPGLRLMAGGLAGVNLGFLYHTRNGNNPAQALASLRLSASLAAVYDFRLGKRMLSARWQADLPLMGVMFSPQYGQSYYEIFSLGHYDHNIVFTYPGNAPSMRHQVSLDFPVGRVTLRAAYLCDMRQSSVNNIRHHSYTHAFMFGWVVRLIRK